MGAKKNNRYFEVYTKEKAIELFQKACEFARNDNDCLCVQDAIRFINIPHSTFYDLIRQHKELDNYKKEINEEVIARINKLGLRNKVNATMAIWRMKQLGESDKQIIEQTNVDNLAVLRELPIEERKKRIKELAKKL